MRYSGSVKLQFQVVKLFFISDERYFDLGSIPDVYFSFYFANNTLFYSFEIEIKPSEFCPPCFELRYKVIAVKLLEPH